VNGLSEGSPFHDFPFRMVPPSYVSWFINPMKTSSFVRCGDPILLKEMPKTWKAAGPLTIGHSCLEETSRSSPARCTRIGPPKFRPQAVQKPDDICYIQNGVASNVNNPMINFHWSSNGGFKSVVFHGPPEPLDLSRFVFQSGGAIQITARVHIPTLTALLIKVPEMIHSHSHT